MYYGVDEHAAGKKHENPMDIDGTGFKPDLYMEKLMKESALTDLYQQEERMKKGELKCVWERHARDQVPQTPFHGLGMRLCLLRPL